MLKTNVKKLTEEWVARKLPKRAKDANKGTFGKVLVIAGSENYIGAPYLVCAAAYRMGAGLVTLATIQSVYKIVGRKIPEVTFLPLPEEDGGIGVDGGDLVVEKLKEYDVLVLGPGLGQRQQTKKFVKRLLKEKLPKTVIDADGLNLLSKMKKWWQQIGGDVLLTPHPGEMARLTGLSVDTIQSDRVGVALKYAKLWNKVVVLKGANTVLASPGREVRVSPFANPILATAGTGDVLSGILAGLIAQGLDLFDASCMSVFLHGLCGEDLKKDYGSSGAIASDLLIVLPKVVKSLRKYSNYSKIKLLLDFFENL